MTIYLCGNRLLPFDSLPLKLKPKLEKAFPQIDFIEFDPNENLRPANKELKIIDTVEGIDKVVIIDDIDKIQAAPLYSLHDFDLGFNLKLLKKIGVLEKATIFGVPMEGNETALFDELMEAIKNNMK